MAEEIKQISLMDLDVYGRNNLSGGALVHTNDYAISNAIILYLTAERGDFLYRQNLAGETEELLFKLITPNTAKYHSAKLEKALKDNFGLLITNISVNIIPDYDSRFYEIQIFYNSVQSGDSNQVIFYTKPNSTNDIDTKIQIDVEYEGDNLLAFVLLKKEEVTESLIQDTSGTWVWGIYRFTNFSQTSSNFTDIYELINSEV